jgi:hypothetical protein
MFKEYTQNTMTLGAVMPVPADAGLNLDNTG